MFLGSTFGWPSTSEALHISKHGSVTRQHFRFSFVFFNSYFLLFRNFYSVLLVVGLVVTTVPEWAAVICGLNGRM